MSDFTLFPIKRFKRRPQKPEAPLRHWVSSDLYTPMEDSPGSVVGSRHKHRSAFAPWALCFVIVVLVICAGFASDIAQLFSQDFQDQNFVISFAHGLQSSASLILFALLVSVCVAAITGGVSGSLLARAPYGRSRFFDAVITYMPILLFVCMVALVRQFQDFSIGFFSWGIILGLLTSLQLALIIRSSIWQARTSDILVVSQTFGKSLFPRVWTHVLLDVLNRLAPALLLTISLICFAELIIGALSMRFGSTLGHVFISMM